MKKRHGEETFMKQQGEGHIQEEECREILIEGEVIHVREGKGLVARVRTEDCNIEVRFFHPNDFHRRYLVVGANVNLTGRLTRWRGRICLIHPRIYRRKTQNRF